MHSQSGRPLIGHFAACSEVTSTLNEDLNVTALLHLFGAIAVWDYASAAPSVHIDMNPEVSDGVRKRCGRLGWKKCGFRKRFANAYCLPALPYLGAVGRPAVGHSGQPYNAKINVFQVPDDPDGYFCKDALFFSVCNFAGGLQVNCTTIQREDP